MAKDKSIEDLKSRLDTLKKTIDQLVKQNVTGKKHLEGELIKSIEDMSKSYSRLLKRYEGTIKKMLEGAGKVREVVKSLQEENTKGKVFNTPEAEKFFNQIVNIVGAIDEEAAALKKATGLYEKLYSMIDNKLDEVIKKSAKHQDLNKLLAEDSAQRIKQVAKEKGLAKYMKGQIEDRVKSLQDELEVLKGIAALDKRSAKENGSNKKRQESILKELGNLARVQEVISKGSKYDELFDSIVKGLNDVSRNYRSVLSMIPVLGPILTSQLDTFQKHLANASKEALNHMEDTGKFLPSIGVGLKHINAQMIGWAGLAMKVSILLGGIYTLFNLIDGSLKNITDSTGLSGNQAYKLYKSALATQTTYANQLSSQKEILDVHKALVNETGLILKYSGAMVGKVSDMSKYFGYSQESAGKFHNIMMQLSGSMPLKDSEELAAKMQFITATLAESAGIAPGIVTKDLVDNAEYVSKVFAGLPEEAALAAVEVRKLGMSLSQASKITEHLFDVSGSLTAAMEASVAVGRIIDTNAARDLAMKGETVELMKEIANQAGTFAEYESMNVGQRILMAKALGMESSELMRMLYIQDRLTNLTDEQKKYMQESGLTLQQMRDMSASDIKLRIKQANQAERFETAIAKVKAALIETILPLAEVFVPLLGIAAKIISGMLYVLKPFKWLFEAINEAASLLSEALSSIFGTTKGIFSVFSKIDEAFSSTSENAIMVKRIVGTILLALGAAHLLVVKGLGGALKAVFSLANPMNWFKFINNGFKGAIDKAKTLASTMSGKAAGGSIVPELDIEAKKEINQRKRKAGFGRPKSTAKPPITPISDALKNPPKMPAANNSISSNLGEVSKSSKLLNPKTILSLSAAMVAFAGSLWLFGKAGQEMAKVDWKKTYGGMLMFAIGMGVIAVAAKFAEKAMIGIVLISAAMLAFGLTMLMIGKAAQLAGAGFGIIAESVMKLADIMDVKLLMLISGLGSSVMALSAGLAAALPFMLLGMATIAGVKIAISSLAKTASKHGDSIGGLAFSMSLLSTSIKDLGIDNLNYFIGSLKDLVAVLKDIDLGVLQKLTDLNYTWSSGEWTSQTEAPAAKTSEIGSSYNNPRIVRPLPPAPSYEDAESTNRGNTSEPSVQMKGVEERLYRIEQIMSKLYLVTRDTAENPPRIVVDFGDGSIRELKVRMTKN